MAGIQINILVVDDDCTSLNIIAEYLQKMNHHVVAMNNPIEALSILRMNRDSFDLILTDVHMPQMSGIELLRHAKEEFQLPVVLMSADCDKDIMLRGLEDGASFFLVKPITQESLTKLWQFAIARNDFFSTERSVVVTSTSPTISANQPTLRRTGGVKENTNKKPKLIWTTSLHNLFLEAVNKIGLERAVPKKILESMNVPGLKRENVASHLQKYRIFLKRIMEASSKSENGFPTNLNERPLRSSFVLNEITYLTNNLQQQYQELLAQRNKVKRGEPSVVERQGVVQSNKVDRMEGSFNNNYVGLRISTNGELIGTLNDKLKNYNHGNNNSTKEIVSEDTPNDANVNQEVNDMNAMNAYNDFSQYAPFGTNGVIFGGTNNYYNDASLEGMSNVNIYISEFDQEAGLLPPRTSNYEVPFGMNFGFGSTQVHRNDSECFDGFDEGIFLNDDPSIENEHAPEIGQPSFEENNQDVNFTKRN